MTIDYLRDLTGRERTSIGNRHLGLSLALIAGAANAGGFLAIKQYTSHMTGIVSSIADDMTLGHVDLALSGLGALFSFVAGAACSAILINWARRRQMQSEYALSLMLESALMLCFGLLGANLSLRKGLFVPMTVMLLCFIMGLQNAIITKISKAEIRTTHVTGLVTDIGIELGKLLYWNLSPADVNPTDVTANRGKLKIHLTMLACFFFGGLLGALGFKYFGFISTVPLAAFLLLLAAVPIADDIVAELRKWRG